MSIFWNQAKQCHIKWARNTFSPSILQNSLRTAGINWSSECVMEIRIKISEPLWEDTQEGRLLTTDSVSS